MNSDALQFLENELNVQFPEGTAAVLEQFRSEHTPKSSFRIMSAEEVMDARSIACPEVSRFGLLPLWTDDESNYAAMAVEEPLLGKISIVDHEQSFDLAPVFRNARSFFESLKSCDEGVWWNIPLDYPQDGSEQLRAASASALESDWSIVQRLSQDLQSEGLDETKRQFISCVILVMTPPHFANTLLRFLDSSDWQVCAKACCVCGVRGVYGAIPKLQEIASTRPELLGYALDGLGLMKTMTSLEVIFNLREKFPKHKASFARAIGLHGWTVDGKGGWKYLDPMTSEWNAI